MAAQVAGKDVGCAVAGEPQAIDLINQRTGWTRGSGLGKKLLNYKTMKSRGTEGVVAQETLRNSDYDEQGRGAASDDESTTTVAVYMVRSPSSPPFCVNLKNTQVQTSSTLNNALLLEVPEAFLALDSADSRFLVTCFLISCITALPGTTEDTNCLMVFFVFLSCCYILIRNSFFI